MYKIRIHNKTISNFCEPYIIAEIGANHNGDMNLAKKMIDAAKQCGANAVKFQSWTPKSLIAKEEYERNQSYNDGDGGKKHFGSLKEMVEKYYLKDEQHFELKKYCDKINIDFCSTPFSVEEVDLLRDVGVGFYKVASMDINNYTLLKYIAKQNKPVLLSTGMATIAEIDNAVRVIEDAGNNQIILLHCISTYPPLFENINLRNISMLQQTFKYPVGFSDHSIGVNIPIAAVALGSCIIEKHFTIDKNMPGWDHEISADPIELKQIVDQSKQVNIALGDFERKVSSLEEEKKKKFRRSLVLSQSLKKGHKIREIDITAKRPGTGIAPNEIKYVLGRMLNKDKDEDELLEWGDLI